MAKYNTITKTATRTEASWTNRQKAAFHAFNPNGQVAELQRLEATIAEIIGDREIPYYGFNSCEYEVELYKMCAQKAVKTGDLWLAMWGLDRRIKAARQHIEQIRTAA